jgi:conjugative transfer ATPase
VSLPPFAVALTLLDRHRPVAIDEGLEGEEPEPADGYAEAEDDRRDILGELELSARIMITGGDVDEDRRITRSDRLTIREAILAAAEQVRRDAGATVLPADVARALRAAANAPEMTDTRRDRVREMADAMQLFTDDASLAGQLFNQPGTLWPDADVTIVDFATLAREGYEAELALAYVSLINRINDVIEQHQNDARHTIVITDEGHLITTNTLLARYVTKITKMWRKLGAWFWLATQNLEDFPAGAKRMLNMMEIWLLLVMPKEEVEQVARFKEINDEVRALMLATRKEKHKFVEGVILTDALQTLIRIVPPPLALALAMTEKEEKADRARLMQELGLASELQAAYAVAEMIAGGRPAATG